MEMSYKDFNNFILEIKIAKTEQQILNTAHVYGIKVNVDKQNNEKPFYEERESLLKKIDDHILKAVRR